MQAAGGQGAADVRHKRKVDEDNQIYNWHIDPRAYELMSKQFQKNEDVKTKMIAHAEVHVVQTKGVAEVHVVKSKGVAEVNAIKLGAAGKKMIDDAEANKINAQTALLRFELAQKQAAAGMATGAEKARTPKEEAMLQKRRDRYAREKTAKGGK